MRVEIGSNISSLPLPHQRKDKVNFGSFGELETGLKQTPVGYTPLFSSATARVYINSILLIRSVPYVGQAARVLLVNTIRLPVFSPSSNRRRFLRRKE